MPQTPALDEGELHSRNLRSIRGWIEAHKSKIKARPNRTVLYSGRHFDFDPALDKADEKAYEGTPMWKRLEQMRKSMKDWNVPCDFETLEDVLKAMRDHPEVVDKDRRALHFASAYEFLEELKTSTTLDALIPNRRKVLDDCWNRLSEIYAANAVGDVKLLTGLSDDYDKLTVDKVFIKKELDALLRNSKLSPKGKDELRKKMSEFGSYFDRRYKNLIAQLDAGKATLTKKRR